MNETSIVDIEKIIWFNLKKYVEELKGSLPQHHGHLQAFLISDITLFGTC